MMGMYYEIDFELWLVSLLFDDERRNSVDDGGWWLMVAVKCTALMKQQRLTAVRFPAFTSSKTTKVAEHETRMFAICHKPGMRVHFYYFYRHQST